MNKSSQSVVVGLIAVVLVGVLVVGFLALPKADQNLRNQAVDGCIKLASTVESETFRGDIYKFCLIDKGYQTNIK